MSRFGKILAAIVNHGEEIESNRKKYAIEVGEISIASNRVHSLFFSLFSCLLGKPFEISKALWETGSTDKSQRIMLKAIIDLVPSSEHRDFIVRALDDAETISVYRNTLVHTIVDINFDTLRMEPSEHNNQDKHLKRSKLIYEKGLYDVIKKDLDDLYRGLVGAIPIVMNWRHGSLPDRPRLGVYAFQTPPKSSQNHPDVD